MQRAGTIIFDNRPIVTAGGLVQLFASVVLLSSAWPLTKLALSLGATPLWFAGGRAVLSCLTGALLVAVRNRIRIPARTDLPTPAAVGALQLAAYLPSRTKRFPGCRQAAPPSSPTPPPYGWCRCRCSFSRNTSHRAAGSPLAWAWLGSRC